MRRTALIVLLAGLCGCAKEPPSQSAADDVSTKPVAARTADPVTLLSITKLDSADTPHLHNLLQLTPTTYSGSEPEGEAGFAELARLGVKVIVSVDGAKPDIETAKKYGLRYIHIPFGYDGISEAAGLSLAHVVRETAATGETLYVHCHHGKHRGPAAAAVICIAAGAADNATAKDILVTAGTSQDYPGLWRDVAAYAPPLAGAVLPELVEVAPVDSLAAAMSSIDRGIDNLKLARDADWQTLPDHPDLAASQEAILVKEAFHEANRNLPAGFTDELKIWLRDAEQQADVLETQLKTKDTTAATNTLIGLEASCKQCHAKYRN